MSKASKSTLLNLVAIATKFSRTKTSIVSGVDEISKTSDRPMELFNLKTYPNMYTYT